MTTTPAQDFISEIGRIWPEENDFFHYPGGGARIAAACLSEAEEDGILLELVKVSRTHLGQGHGSRILDRLCADADRFGVSLHVEIVPTGPLDAGALICWYRKRGFDIDPIQSPLREGLQMSRCPASPR